MNLGLTLCTGSWALLKGLTLWLGHENEGTKLYCPWNWDHLLESTLGCPTSWGSYFTLLSGEELLSPQWDPVTLMQVGPMETLYVDVCAPLNEGMK